MTRWYRAPEIAHMDPNYNQSVDIWSLGCILGEFIHCSNVYPENSDSNRFLFKGGSCSPFSPETRLNQAEYIDIKDDDQLI